MGIFNALFGKPPKRKSATYADWHQPAVRNQASNCDENDVDGMGYYITRDVGNAEQFTIDPECEDCYDLYWEDFDELYHPKVQMLKQQGRTFFVVSTFNGHCEGADIYYRICESREQMETVRLSYDDMSDSYIPHEFVLNVVDGEEVDTPPEWWTDYEGSFNRSVSKRYRL
jgi:hypothetical protein